MMSEQKNIRSGEKALSDLIRKELVSESNRRLLDRIPDFKPDAELPEHFRNLLGQLDRAEARERE